jgi:hypothetical protein
MKMYTLKRETRPPQLAAGQAEVVYKCLEPFGTRYSLEELLLRAKKRGLSAHFKNTSATTIPGSLHHHLKRFIEAGYVRVEETTSR